MSGFWEAQTHQVNDDDARVIILNGEGEDFQVFFEQKNDTTLQKLNASDKEMEPASVYTLRKITAKPAGKDSVSEHDNLMARLTGTYKGKLPCGDCEGIMSTLTLHFKKHTRYGDYTLSDKYTGTPNGDISNDRKGKWCFTSKLIEADHKSLIIELDPDMHGRETYYYVKKDGIIQIDKSMHGASPSADRTLKKQK
jgi:hypothetical protein